MRDFTLHSYETLLQALKEVGYRFLTFEQYCEAKPSAESRVVVMRHDVDLKPDNSVRTAEIEQRLGIAASYFFRIVPASNQPQAIRAIAAMGHEIGYHYEDLSLAKGDIKQAYRLFEEHLAYFRQFYPIRTICMHGVPTSEYDGRDLWKSYDYRKAGVIGEPYFDVNFDETLYLTDTGRRWDGYKVSVRDKVPQQQQWIEARLVFHRTEDICRWLQSRPKKNIMITTHPQRWTNSSAAWLKEWGLQNMKNIVKRILICLRG